MAENSRRTLQDTKRNHQKALTKLNYRLSLILAHYIVILNLIKTKELIFHNPKARTCHSNLPVLLNIERITSAKLLGIYIQSNFSCDIHFNHIMTVSIQRLHILKVHKR